MSAFLKKNKKTVDKNKGMGYNAICVTQMTNKTDVMETGCGSAWLERLVWDQEVAGSNPVTPICAGVVQW